MTHPSPRGRVLGDCKESESLGDERRGVAIQGLLHGLLLKLAVLLRLSRAEPDVGEGGPKKRLMNHSIASPANELESPTISSRNSSTASSLTERKLAQARLTARK